MAGVYTRRLGSLQISDTSWHIVFDHPGVGTVVVRDIVMTNLHASSPAAVQWRMTPKAREGDVVLWAATLEAQKTVHVDLRQVLAVNEYLRVSADVSPLYVLVTGYVFE